MSADVLTLPVVYDPQRPETRVERARERLTDARCWVQAKTIDKVPVVVISRAELARECERYLRR